MGWSPTGDAPQGFSHSIEGLLRDTERIHAALKKGNIDSPTALMQSMLVANRLETLKRREMRRFRASGTHEADEQVGGGSQSIW